MERVVTDETKGFLKKVLNIAQVGVMAMQGKLTGGFVAAKDPEREKLKKKLYRTKIKDGLLQDVYDPQVASQLQQLDTDRRIATAASGAFSSNSFSGFSEKKISLSGDPTFTENAAKVVSSLKTPQ